MYILTLHGHNNKKNYIEHKLILLLSVDPWTFNLVHTVIVSSVFQCSDFKEDKIGYPKKLFLFKWNVNLSIITLW